MSGSGSKLLIVICLLAQTSIASLGQGTVPIAYDSVMVLTIHDPSLEHLPPGADRTDPVKITGRAKLNKKQIAGLHSRAADRNSYGQSQAVTPIYDLKIQYFNEGGIADEVSISLWTNNFFATFPLQEQRQGECLCDGDSGHCCTEGGISMKFKKYLIDLLEDLDLPIEKKEILEFGK